MRFSTLKRSTLLTAGIFAAVCFFFNTSLTTAQTQTLFSNISALHDFGNKIIFTADIESAEGVQSIEAIFKPSSSEKSTSVTAKIEANNQVNAEYDIRSNDNIFPFTEIQYQFIATLETGEQIESSTETFIYDDNRFTWQSISDDSSYFNIYWAEGEFDFGQTSLETAVLSLDNLNTYLDLPEPQDLNIYIYPTTSALQDSLEVTDFTWVAGHADPSLNQIFVSIAPGFDQSLDMKRQIPHEITHIRLYLYLQNNYSNLPSWFNEGTASISQLYSSTEYWQILQAAFQNDQLIPFEELCATFPYETEQASLAYAQSDSFIRHIFTTYGKIGLQSLLDAYKQGHSCENGVQTSLGLSLQELERAWYQDTFNQAYLPLSAKSAIAWGILLVLVLGTPVAILILQNTKSKN